MSAVLLWIPPIAWAAVLFVLSGGNPPRVAPDIPHIDKLQHFVAYAILGALLARAMARGRPEKGRAAILGAGALASLYGVTDEIHQSFTPGRLAEVGDAVADALGGFAGAWAFVAWLRRRRTPEARNA